MRYPKSLEKKDVIGLLAPSFGVSGFKYEKRFEAAKEKFTKLGYQFKECQSLYGITKLQSADGQKRGEEFMNFYLDEDVDFINSVAGGEIMCDMLGYVDFEKIAKANPKYFMGMSDNTNLTFLLNVNCDVASIYGFNFGSFGMRRWHKSLKEGYEVMCGMRTSQTSYSKYEAFNDDELADPLCSFNLKKPVIYKSLDNKDHHFEGRLVGGCLDILQVLCGTDFVKMKEFQQKYKEDGFIWFMEACDLTAPGVFRALWQLKNAGWFEYCKGMIIGRALNGAELMGYEYEDGLKMALAELNIPVIYDCDFGHVAPCWTIISGSYGIVDYNEGKCRIEYQKR